MLFKCNFRDLDLVCGLDQKPFVVLMCVQVKVCHSGESAVEVLILIFLGCRSLSALSEAIRYFRSPYLNCKIVKLQRFIAHPDDGGGV